MSTQAKQYRLALFSTEKEKASLAPAVLLQEVWSFWDHFGVGSAASFLLSKYVKKKQQSNVAMEHIPFIFLDDVPFQTSVHE